MSLPGWLESWHVHKTAFTVAVVSRKGFGNGIVVDCETVVTCTHVVLDPNRHAGLVDEITPDWGAVALAWRELPWPLEVFRGGAAVPVARVFVHNRLDLAVLTLARPLLGRAAPLLRAPALSGRDAWAPYLATDGAASVREIPALPVQVRDLAARDATKVGVGLPEGNSGGGVFVATKEGPALAGLATRGGRRSPIGEIIPGEAVLGFLAECGRAPSARPDSLAAQALWADGVCCDPFSVPLPGGAQERFVPLGVVDGAFVWIGQEPVCNFVAGTDGPGRHPLKRATGLTREQARDVIARLDDGLGLAAGLQARLPRRAELLRAHEAAPRAVNLPGPREAEWVDDPGLAAMRHDASARPPFADVRDPRASSEIGFRLVLEERRG